MELDAPDEKGFTPRQRLQKVYEQSGVMPKELEEEVKPEFWDEPIFDTFFEIYQRDKEFYQSIYYYQKVMGFEFDGEDITLLFLMWNTAQKYLSDKDNKKRQREQNKPKKKNPVSRMLGR